MTPAQRNLLRRLAGGPVDISDEQPRNVVAQCYFKGWIRPKVGLPGYYCLTKPGQVYLDGQDTRKATATPRRVPVTSDAAEPMREVMPDGSGVIPLTVDAPVAALPHPPRRTPDAPGWTSARVDRLEQLVGDGVLFSEIATDLGITKNTAIGKAIRMGFERRQDAVLNDQQVVRQKVKAAAKAAAATAKPTPDIFPDRGGCVWPNGHPEDKGFHFCATPIKGAGLPYCPAHMEVAYVRRKAGDAAINGRRAAA